MRIWGGEGWLLGFVARLCMMGGGSGLARDWGSVVSGSIGEEILKRMRRRLDPFPVLPLR